MSNLSRDYVMSYDPQYEYHSDSTDFEDSRPRVSPKKAKHNLFKEKKVSNVSSRDVRLFFNSRQCFSRIFSGCSSKETTETYCINRGLEMKKKFINKISATFDSGDQIQAIKSKRSLIREKVIPVISSMFKRPNYNVNPMAVIEESVKLKSSCQPSNVYYKSRIRNHDRNNEYYNEQPVYAVERTEYAPNPFQSTFGQTLLSRKRRNEYLNAQYSLTSSSDVERKQSQKKQHKGKKWKKQLQNDFLSPEKRKRSHRLLSKRPRKPPCEVFVSPEYERISTGAGTMSDFSTSTETTIPSTCSGFWEYIFNKINSRYQNPDVFRSCNCEFITSNKSCKSKSSPKSSKVKPLTKLKPCCCHPQGCPSACLLPRMSSEPKSSSSVVQQPKPKPKNTTPPPPPKKVDCECHIKEKEKPKPPPPSRNQQLPPCAQGKGPCPLGSAASTQLPKPCQLPHDVVVKSLSQKYKGEILCIHNPPCVLINGCLNLPKSETMTTACPLFDYSKFSYQTPSQDLCSRKIVDQCCQYQGQSTELQTYDLVGLPLPIDQYQMSETNKEKIVQSSCSHKPPCEVKRTCQRPKYDPALTSCVHVPMCNNLPVCILRSSYVDKEIECHHSPKCANVPTCTRDHMVLTASEEVATQVRLKTKTTCRHVPPCIMIPKCLARGCAGYIPYEAIPDCVHQPMCDMIPACCRKTGKEMVSVCSQYPNSCRIV